MEREKERERERVEEGDVKEGDHLLLSKRKRGVKELEGEKDLGEDEYTLSDLIEKGGFGKYQVGSLSLSFSFKIIFSLSLSISFSYIYFLSL